MQVPACLTPFHDFVFYPFLYTGWGQISNCVPKVHNILQELKMKVMKTLNCTRTTGNVRQWNKETNKCENLTKVYYFYSVHPEMFCTEAPRSSICLGDSGGPFMVKKDDQHYIAGISSNIYGCAEVIVGMRSTLNKHDPDHELR